MCLACDGLGVRHDFDPELAGSRSRRSRSGTARSRRSGRSRTWASGGGICSRGSPPISRPTRTARPRGRCSRGPGADLDERFRNVWLYGAGDRVIVHHWKNRRRIWSHAEKWEGVATELLARYRKSAGGPTRAQLEPYMRSMTCPECQGCPAQRPRPGRARGRQDAGRAGRHAHRPGRPVLRCPGRAADTDRRKPADRIAARCTLADHRRRAAEGDPRPAQVLDQRGPALPGARPRPRLRSPAARPSASGWPARSARGWSACSTFSTSPRSACIRATTTA